MEILSNLMLQVFTFFEERVSEMTESELKEIEARMLEYMHPGTLTRVEVIGLIKRMLKQADMSQEKKDYKRALRDILTQVALYGASAK